MRERRKFIALTLFAILGNFIFLLKNLHTIKFKKNKEDFINLGYCCYPCDENCKTYLATVNNNVNQKKIIAERWKDKYKREFKIEEVYCYGCRKEEEKVGYNQKNCSIRKCAIEKNLKSCAHCYELEDCKKELYKEWPSIKRNAMEIKSHLKPNKLSK